ILMRACRLAGARTALMERFVAADFVATAEATGATICFLVPTQVERLLALGDAAHLPSMRAVIVAGAPFAPDSRRRFAHWLRRGDAGGRADVGSGAASGAKGAALWEFYGSSETGTITVLHPDEEPPHPGFVGRPPAGTEIRILDETRAPSPTGSVGEVYVRSP